MKVEIFFVFLYLYRKKVVWIVGFDWGGRLVEVLFFVGFYDIWGDIEILGVDCGKMGILLGLVGFYFRGFKIKLV